MRPIMWSLSYQKPGKLGQHLRLPGCSAQGGPMLDQGIGQHARLGSQLLRQLSVRHEAQAPAPERCLNCWRVGVSHKVDQ